MQTKQDQKLEEVRAILQRLQRISAGEEHEDAAPTGPGPAAQPAPNGRALDEAASPRPGAGHSRGAKAAAVVLPVALIGVAGAVFWSLPQDEAPPAPPVPQSTAAFAPPAQQIAPERKPLSPQLPPPVANPDAERLAVARGLMDKGKVSEARRVLKNDLASRNAEAALLLARSYDPNSLQQIANPDASPDPAEAERWYRRWAEIAAGQGLELDKERLDRIIKAMR